MKTYMVLGGYGGMGRIASMDLAKTAKGRIIIAGRDGTKAKKYARKLGKGVIGVEADATDAKKLSVVLKKNKVDVVVNCAVYYVNLEVMKACLIAKCHYLDLGGLFHMTKKQLKLDKQFRKNRLLAVLGCGSTPGITNVMAGYAAEHMDNVDSIQVRFAGYSYAKPQKHFVAPYSMYTVFDEFTAKPAVFTKGRMTFVKPVTGRATEYYPDPVGQVKTFYTLHSELATFPASFKKKGLKECDFKVAFDEDFVHDVRVMIDAGMSSKIRINIDGKSVMPVDVAAKELNRLQPKNKKADDIEYIRTTLRGEKDKKPMEITMDCIARSNKKWNAAAGDIDTGVPPSIIAQLIAGNKIHKTGVMGPETCVHPVQFFHELTKRGMKITTTLKFTAFE